MKKKTLFGLLVLMLLLLPLFAACAKSTSTTTSTQISTPAETSTPVQTTTPSLTSTSTSTTADWWDSLGTPKYGGTINVQTDQLENISLDPTTPGVQANNDFWLENLFRPNWAVNPKTWAFNIMWTPTQYYTGALAQSFDINDPSTVTLHLRQGVHWQNKYPTNGREFVASDVVYCFNRILGTGDGYTTPNPMIGPTYSNFASATATDKYTVVLKLKQPSAFAIDTLMNSGFGIGAKEWYELNGSPVASTSSTASAGGPPVASTSSTASAGGSPGGSPPGGGPPPAAPLPTGPIADWHNVVGTNVWMLSDYQNAISMTFSANPTYWGTDERYPQNKLPYASTLKLINIPDMGTTLAALRTDKIDMLVNQHGPSIQQAQSLGQTNPDIKQGTWPGQGWCLMFRCDKAPFTNLKVRTALQMAVDNPAIAKSYYMGKVDGTVAGLISPILKGWTLPFNQWPQTLQNEYTYNPQGAKQLLADAGYPNGFKTSVLTSSSFPVDLLEIVQSEFANIGVNMQIIPDDMPTFMSLSMAGKIDQMSMGPQTAMSGDPVSDLRARITGFMQNSTYNNDPKYDAMYKQLNTAASMDDAMKISTEMDQYALQQHWSVNMCASVINYAYQPYIKGYSGQANVTGDILARLWIDKSTQ